MGLEHDDERVDSAGAGSDVRRSVASVHHVAMQLAFRVGKVEHYEARQRGAPAAIQCGAGSEPQDCVARVCEGDGEANRLRVRWLRLHGSDRHLQAVDGGGAAGFCGAADVVIRMSEGSVAAKRSDFIGLRGD